MSEEHFFRSHKLELFFKFMYTLGYPGIKSGFIGQTRRIPCLALDIVSNVFYPSSLGTPLFFYANTERNIKASMYHTLKSYRVQSIFAYRDRVELDSDIDIQP